MVKGNGLEITMLRHPKMILPPLAVCSRFCFDQRLSLTLELSGLNAASNGDVDDIFPVAISW